MKILLIGDRVRKLEQVQNYSGMWVWYLSLALTALGHSVVFGRRYKHGESIERYIEEILALANGCDAIVALGVRYFCRLPATIGLALKERFPGPVVQVNDGPRDDPLVDFTVSVRDGPYAIGWAADPAMYYPEQTDGLLRIFIDHCHPGLSGWDYTYTQMHNLSRLKVPFVAHTLNDRGIERVEPGAFRIHPYGRTAVPAPVLAAELRRSHIFMVTHPESVGLTALEASMAGAMVLAPRDCIPIDRIETIDHHFTDPLILWDSVISSLDPERTHKRARVHTWERTASRLVGHLEQWPNARHLSAV